MSVPRARRAGTLPRPAVLASALGFGIAAWSVIAVAWWPVYRDPTFVTMAVVAILAGTALAVISVVLRWPAWGLIAAVAGVIAVLGVPLAVPSRAVYGVLPQPDGLLALAESLVFGWRNLVTIDLPVGSYQALLVPAFATLIVGPAATTAVALRARWPAVAVAIPALAYPLVLAVGPEQVRWPISTTLALLLVVLLWLAAWRRHARTDQLAGSVDAARGGAVRQFAAAATIVLVAGGAGSGLIALLPPTDDRVVVRTLVEQPFDPFAVPSPLAAYRASFSPDRANAPALVATPLADGQRVRVAVLDSYDGVVFSVGSDRVDSASGRFERVPARRDVPGEATVATIAIELARSFGPWLPTVGELVDVRFSGGDAATRRDRVARNAVTDSAVLVGGAPSGLSYELDVLVADDSDRPLDRVSPGAQAVPAIVAQPDALIDWLGSLVDPSAPPGEQLAAVVAHINQQGFLSHGGADEPPSRPGHSLDRLEALMTQGPLVGDAEQYAVLAALAARELGFPSRVVLGFVEGVRDPAGPSATQQGLFRERDLTAWVEVGTAEAGWLALDVVPTNLDVPPADTDDTTPVTRPQPAIQPPLDDAIPPDEQAPPEVTLDDDEASAGLDPALLLALRIGGGMLALAIIALAPFATIAAIKARRRRRRRRASDPATRILGAWMQATDDLIDGGADLPVGGTRRERAVASGRPALLVLARVADRAVYAPEEPDPADADRVWESVDATRATDRATMTRRHALRAAVSPRSLRRYPDRDRRRQRRTR